MQTFKFLGGQVKENDGTVTIFGGAGTKKDVAVSIFYLVSNGDDVTVTLCGKDAHL
jgi:hypothetical protein